MPDVFTISEITTHIRYLLDREPTLQDTWIQGEVSNMTRAASGHWYFTLKDNSAELRCVMWRSDATRQSFVPDNGDSILVHGSVSLYSQRGDIQFYTDFIRAEGIGDLYAQFEQLKAKLNAEGLFDPEHKKPLPSFPLKIGVVTSVDAAAFQDVQNVLRRRFPLAEVILSPTLVQGNNAPPMIVKALTQLDQPGKVDVILMVRGGGSIEDLWAFNDETVASAVFNANTPIITGVGHETDFTIVDFVADFRAPTPSAAAEVATPNIADLAVAITQQRDRLTTLIRSYLTTLQNDTTDAQRNLNYLSPAADLRNYRQHVDELTSRLRTLQQSRLNLLRERLAAKKASLEAASPQTILKRGYAIVTRKSDGVIIRQDTDAPAGTSIEITLANGKLRAKTED